MKCTGVDRVSKFLPLSMTGLGCFRRARISACSIAAEYVLYFQLCMTSSRALVKEYLPGSGAMASQLLADMVSVILVPLGKVALAAPAQQSKRMSTSDRDRSRRVWIADHLVDHQWVFKKLRYLVNTY